MIRLPRLALLVVVFAVPCLAQTTQPTPPMPEPVQFTTETLDNGLQVIYAPLHNAPVVHVRVLYHVGSRDERPDRQGFAHMFEHMMFRGSAHVPPEEHMKLIGEVGGISNAFTSYDQTTYHDTVPSLQTQMALYLEADRMSSFKVSDDIFKTERKVVSEEWRLRNANPPYGQLFQDFARTAYTNHSYRWTPIGDMDQLRMAKSAELQAFFNKYYVPNNVCLIVAGDIDTEQTKKWVHDYFGWIPKGADVVRDVAQEPEQTAERHLTVKKFVPLPHVVMGYKTTTYTSDDHYALGLLGDILGSGKASRLYKQLVNNQTPLCVSADAGDEQQEDLSVFILSASVLQGADVNLVEKTMEAAVQQMADKPVTEDELNLAKTQDRVAIIHDRETCTQIATALGEAAVFGKDPNRVNTDLKKIDAVTPEMIQAVAKKYLQTSQLTTVEYIPDALNLAARKAAAQAAATRGAAADALNTAPVAASDEPITARVVEFPRDYPTKPPLNDAVQTVTFNKGTTQDVDGMPVITMHDARLPLISFSLVLRRGGFSEPAHKEGLGGIAAAMLSRGAGQLNAEQISQDLESRGITINATDNGDNTNISGSCTSDQIDHAIDRMREMVLQPTFPEDEFAKLKQQSLSRLKQSLADPSTVASRELNGLLFGEETPLGRSSTPASLAGITLDDVNAYYQATYHPDGALLVFAGDVTPEQSKTLAARLLASWKPAGPEADVDYSLPTASNKLRITLVDNPNGKQSTIRMGIRSYNLHSDEKFAGSLAGSILSSGIDSRLNKYVRAEKGYTYGARGLFQPYRHDGYFEVSVDTNPDTTGPCIEACWKVLNDMASGGISDEELKQSQRRVSGGMVMDVQTIDQQAGRRIDGVMNGYPADYYDHLPEHLSAVTADQVKDVVAKYAQPKEMEVIVVGPASVIQSQLESLGTVQVVPMPSAAKSTSAPAQEMMKPAAMSATQSSR